MASAPPPLLSEGPYDYGEADSPDGATAELLERMQAAWLARVQAALHAHFPALPAAKLGETLSSNEAAVINVHDILRGEARVVLGVAIHALPALLRELGIARTAVVARPVSWPTDRFEMMPEGDAAAPWLGLSANVGNAAFHLLLVESHPGLVLLPSRELELDDEWSALAARVGKSWSPFDV
jgi:hypothetical protein